MTQRAPFWFGQLPELMAGERWMAHYPANRTQGKRAVGGGLHVSSQRVMFAPNALDRSLGGKAWSCRLDDIVNIGVEPPHRRIVELFSGAWAVRLRIELQTQGTELFVVSQVRARVDELRGLCETTTGRPLAPQTDGRSEFPAARLVDR